MVLFLKKSYDLQMRAPITELERFQANKSLLCFKYTQKSLVNCKNYLSLIGTPFKDNPEMEVDDILQIRAALRRYRDQAVDQFNSFKEMAFKCVQNMHIFSNDTQTVKLMKSFIDGIETLEDTVNKFVALFDDLKDKEFPKNIVKSIKNIEIKCDEVIEMIDQRIKPYIQTEILSSNWVDQMSDSLKMTIDKKEPLLLSLHNQEEKALLDNKNPNSSQKE